MAKFDVLDERVDLNYFDEQFRIRIRGILDNPTHYGKCTTFFSRGEKIETNGQLLRLVRNFNPPQLSEKVVYETLVKRFKEVPSIGSVFAGFLADYVIAKKLVDRIPRV